MGILKDHMSYMLGPKMKVSTDMVAAYTLKNTIHLQRLRNLEQKFNLFNAENLI